MPLLVYRPRNFDQTHEREQFRNLCVMLKERYSASPDEMCIFIGNFNIGDVELDGIIIKDEGIAIVEFKDYGGKITAVENGDWISEEDDQRSVIRGGAGRKNPYSQAKINRNACRPVLSETGALTPKQASRLTSMIVFHRQATIENRISPHVKWLRVCDEHNFVDELDLIVSSDCDLRKEDFKRIIERLSLDSEWLCVRYSNPDVLKSMNFEVHAAHAPEETVKPSDNVSVPKFEEQAIPNEKRSSELVPTIHREESHQNFVAYMERVFSALGISGRFEVIDIKNNPIPSWVESSQATNEFLVAAVCLGFKNKIERFISRPVFERDGVIYWFDGEPLEKEHHSFKETSSPVELEHHPIEPLYDGMKTSTRLPQWLDRLIYEDLKGRWEADHEKFESNLHSTQADALVYLGTYFPRSYADTFCIFNNFFSINSCRSCYGEKDSIKILSVGCGTGGDIIGLLTAVLKNFAHFTDIDVYAIDGNPYALSILETVFNGFCKITKCPARLYVKQMVFESSRTFNILDWNDLGFDFIVSCKMIGEMISAGKGANDNAYYDFGKCFLPRLNPTGVCLILDVTTKPSHTSSFYPHMMSEQMNRLVREEPDYEILVPVCCSQYGRACHDSRCFQQKEFTVSHSRRNNDKCRVAYRLMVRSGFMQTLGLNYQEKRMLVYEGAICSFTSEYGEDSDPFLLSNILSEAE